MTKRESNFSNRVLATGCIALLFFHNVYTYPYEEFEFPKSSVNENSRSNNDQYANQTTAATVYERADHSQISKASVRSQVSQDDEAALNDGTDQYEAQKGQRRLLREHYDVEIDSKIIFPTESTPTHHPYLAILGRAPVCQGSTYCETTSYYPDELVNAAIEQNENIKYFATTDALVPDVEDRIGVTDESPLCLYNEQVIYPTSAENKNKEWLFILNHDKFKQGVRIETCINENKSCNIIDGLIDGYTTACKQKYIYRQLAAISGNGTVMPDLFRFPSSCCCHLKFIGKTLSRLGIISERKSKTNNQES